MCPAAAPPEGPGADTQPITRAPAQPEPGFAAGPRGRRRSGLAVVILFGLAAIGAVAFFLLRSGNTATPGSQQGTTSTEAPARSAFAFKVGRVRAVNLSRRSVKKQSAEAADAIAQRLSVFYDRAFADPASWKNGVPADTWNVFAAPVRATAKHDANSFTPATTGVNLASFEVTKSVLRISISFDTSAHPQAAFVTVLFRGTGQLVGGEKVQVENTATFLFRPASGTWFIAGYPDAKTTLEAGNGSVGTGASVSPSAGSSP